MMFTLERVFQTWRCSIASPEWLAGMRYAFYVYKPSLVWNSKLEPRS